MSKSLTFSSSSSSSSDGARGSAETVEKKNYQRCVALEGDVGNALLQRVKNLPK